MYQHHLLAAEVCAPKILTSCCSSGSRRLEPQAWRHQAFAAFRRGERSSLATHPRLSSVSSPVLYAAREVHAWTVDESQWPHLDLCRLENLLLTGKVAASNTMDADMNLDEPLNDGENNMSGGDLGGGQLNDTAMMDNIMNDDLFGEAPDTLDVALSLPPAPLPAAVISHTDTMQRLGCCS